MRLWTRLELLYYRLSGQRLPLHLACYSRVPWRIPMGYFTCPVQPNDTLTHLFSYRRLDYQPICGVRSDFPEDMTMVFYPLPPICPDCQTIADHDAAQRLCELFTEANETP